MSHDRNGGGGPRALLKVRVRHHDSPLDAVALEVEERAAVLGREGADDLEHAAHADGHGRRRARPAHICKCNPHHTHANAKHRQQRRLTRTE